MITFHFVWYILIIYDGCHAYIDWNKWVFYTVIIYHNPVYIDYLFIIMDLTNICTLTSVIELLKHLFSNVSLFVSLNNHFNPIKVLETHQKESQLIQFIYRKLWTFSNPFMKYKILRKLTLLYSLNQKNIKNALNWDLTDIINVISSVVYCIMRLFSDGLLFLVSNNYFNAIKVLERHQKFMQYIYGKLSHFFNPLMTYKIITKLPLGYSIIHNNIKNVLNWHLKDIIHVIISLIVSTVSNIGQSLMLVMKNNQNIFVFMRNQLEYI